MVTTIYIAVSLVYKKLSIGASTGLWATAFGHCGGLGSGSMAQASGALRANGPAEGIGRALPACHLPCTRRSSRLLGNQNAKYCFAGMGCLVEVGYSG